ncbi:chorismate mutase [Nocardia sp. NPDC056611]|uniref:chorismate mutase n=1 Tax=Nocardia sp. NPDC056611 TaxID=3345877 RepID=UPI0036721E9D
MRNLAIAAAAAMVLLAGRGGVAEADAGNTERLVGLLAERLATADTVAAIKWEAAVRDGGEPVIDDPGREAAIYDAMAQAGAERGLPGGRVREVFHGQIEANKIVQRGLMTEWRYGLAAAQVPGTDLAGVRPVIDGLNTVILDELASERKELAEANCPTRVAAGVVAVAGSKQLDALHSASLARASTPLCGG